LKKDLEADMRGFYDFFEIVGVWFNGFKVVVFDAAAVFAVYFSPL